MQTTTLKQSTKQSTNSATSMIQLNGIEKFHRSGLKKHYILKNINLSITEGEFITIMGPSGAGKSTLLHILGMLETASGGSYDFYGHPIHKMSERKKNELHKQYMGFVFQAYHLIDELTVYGISKIDQQLTNHLLRPKAWHSI